ncbi:MAG: hypothetical protein FWC34_10260 [Bacteroidetes bacterium]|nr:hypothetical protein [Bacteroidota bacterium]MCL2302131.1 hypothetical protein [Lentimicrobiaceae bacterium]
MKKTIFIFFFGALFLGVNAQLSTPNPWTLSGNANTSSSNFLGTTDAKPIIFKTDNIERMRLLQDKTFLGIGVPNPNATLHIHDNSMSDTNTYSTTSRIMQMTNDFTGSGPWNGFNIYFIDRYKGISFQQQEQANFYLEGPGGGLTIAPDGNVGVGLSNFDSPQAKLDVDGSFKAQSAAIVGTLTANTLNAQTATLAGALSARSANITTTLTANALNAQTATLTGALSAQSANITNTLTANALNAQTATLTGALGAQSANITNTLTANALNAQTATLTGALGAQSANITNTLTANALNAQTATLTGTLSTQSANITNTLTANALNAQTATINGTATTNNLRVNNLLCAKEIKVQIASCWPDYVFSKDYKLPTLNEVEQFITENQHLPNVPSAAKVEINGVNLGEMNAILLLKVEELTLYIIQMQKQIDELKQTKGGK